MRKIRTLVSASGGLALILAMGLSGCGSSSSQCGVGGCLDGGGSDAPGVFGLSEGTNCFKITAVAAGSSDGCMLGVATLVGQDLPVTYSSATATVSVGTSGSLGAGTVNDNVGTLTRSGTTTDSQMTTCSWTQMDTTMLTLTADNTFNASVVEMQSGFAAACSGIPTGGSCSSSWSWTMTADGSKSPSNGCQ